MTPELEKIHQLCLSLAESSDPKMKWTWGEGLLGYAYGLLDDYSGRDDFTAFLSSYCDYYVAHQPEVCSSDTSAPGLVTYSLWKKTKKLEYEALTEKVLFYIKNEPRLLEGIPNHFGHNGMSHLYPRSIWVDSLMMFSVFPALYASENKDEKLLRYAAGLPTVFSQYLQDPKTGLWHHSYWVKRKKPYPGKGIYWGRGNGWVMAALPMLLERLPDSDPDKAGIIAIFKKTAAALLSCQHEDGLFSTLLQQKSYEETSCSALIASGFFAGIRLGYLSKETYLAPALRSFHAVMTNVLPNKQGKLEFRGISGPTIPLWPCPKLNYRLIGRKANWSYGVAALVFAGLEFDRQNENK
jgi:Predicted unsaturated glucuronyl hydrolase involved in regulation of bacterial surface properties, and related proteins